MQQKANSYRNSKKQFALTVAHHNLLCKRLASELALSRVSFETYLDVFSQVACGDMTLPESQLWFKKVKKEAKDNKFLVDLQGSFLVSNVKEIINDVYVEINNHLVTTIENRKSCDGYLYKDSLRGHERNVNYITGVLNPVLINKAKSILRSLMLFNYLLECNISLILDDKIGIDAFKKIYPYWEDYYFNNKEIDANFLRGVELNEDLVIYFYQNNLIEQSIERFVESATKFD